MRRGGQHLAIQRAGLAEVVVLSVFDVRGPRDLARFYLPTREFVGRVGLGPAKGVGCIDGIGRIVVAASRRHGCSYVQETAVG